ncbi:porin [Pasteurellaceae bacterium USgator11]|nr:porin [Pasteurellaceae bacterium USgator41]TNG98499.1 porin [Pasteurellaceae bacterium USgator11]
MKKTLVALAVAAVAATSANAAVVYDQDGSKVEVGGSVRLVLQKAKDKRTDLLNNGSRITVNASQDLGNGLSAVGQLEIRPDFSSDTKTSRLWAGFKQEGVGTLTFGKLLTIGDELGQSDFTYNFGGINKVTDSGDKVAHFRSANFGGFSFGVDYLFGNSAKTKEVNGQVVKVNNNRGYVVGALYNNKFGDLGIDAAVGFSQDNRSTDATVVSGTLAEGNYKEKGFTSGLRVSYDKFAVGFDYSQRKTDDKAQGVTFRVVKKDDGGKAILTKYHKISEYELGLKYQVTDASKVYGEWLWGKGKALDEADTKFNGFILGADYKIHKNVVTYLEGITIKGKQAGNTVWKDNAVNLGLRVFF